MIEIRGRNKTWYLDTEEEKKAYEELVKLERQSKQKMLNQDVIIRNEKPIDLGLKDIGS